MLEIRNINKTFNPGTINANHALRDLSLDLTDGESIAVIGGNGAGKSTLLNLLLRLYDVSEGRVLLDGRDIRTIPYEQLREKFGVVFQNDFLYADTVEENIRFGRDITSEDIVKATKITQAHDFISSFSDGYNHMLSPHGTNISGGQKQRILISRAIAANPEILILDDSSSALDYKTDAALRRALAENMGDTTLVTVAQRVSSVKDCSVIMVLDEGRIIGIGKHEELLEKCPEYREISESQMGGAIVD